MERPNNKQPINLEQARQRIQGYFDGQKDTLTQEIAFFQKLGPGVRIEEGQVYRPDLSVEALQRLIAELVAAEKYILEIFNRIDLDDKLHNEN